MEDDSGHSGKETQFLFLKPFPRYGNLCWHINIVIVEHDMTDYHGVTWPYQHSLPSNNDIVYSYTVSNISMEYILSR